MNIPRGGKTILLILFALFMAAGSHAQRTKSISGEYTFVSDGDISLSEAKRIAAERARIEALASEFGTTINQTNTTQTQNIGENSSTSFFSIGNSEVKGEWLADTKEPEYEVTIDGANMIIKACVWGKAREIKSATVDLDVAVLCNGTEKKFESDYFKEGDDMFIHFKSPISGFVAIYLIDEEQNAYCLLPYSSDENGRKEVRSGKKYIFFDTESADSEEDKSIIDQLTMTCAKPLEHNRIMVIFSSTPFVKAIDTQSQENVPRSLSFEDFQKWLVKNRTKDPEMAVVERLIKIEKK
ncbi:MAG: DUF4384 domain-containing protein [Bacteroidaceae bacterium]|nr:DUF4384 domain-containing protein [Bacteroidaceae bacterium]